MTFARLGFSQIEDHSLVPTPSSPSGVNVPIEKLVAPVVPRKLLKEWESPEEALGIRDQEFQVPLDELHATTDFSGKRILTGTRDGSLAAFTVERRGDSYDVVELGKGELAWLLGRIILIWTAVASALFAGLFTIAEKFRREKRRS